MSNGSNASTGSAGSSLSQAGEPADQRDLTASTLALTVAVAATMAFLPPWASSTLSSVARTVATALVLATAALLHWIFLGLAAQRLEHSAWRWVPFSVLLFPIGGATTLILFNWFADELPAPAPHA